MSPTKIEVLLDKITQLLANLPDQEISALDRDLMLEYIRGLYAEVLEWETGKKVEPPSVKINPSPEAKVQPAEPIKKETAREALEQESHSAEKPSVEERISFLNEGAPAPKNEPEGQEEKPEVQPLSMEERSRRVEDIYRQLEELKKERESKKPVGGETPTTSPKAEMPHDPAVPTPTDSQLPKESEPALPEIEKEPKKPALQEKEEEDLTLYEKFQQEKEDDLVNKMKSNPIQDLRTEIDINNRFWFINELFDGNGDAFKSHIKKLNEMNNFKEAADYVEQALASKYDWEKKENVVEKFMRLIRRRY